MSHFTPEQITGATGDDIAASIRALVDSGVLTAGDALPPVRSLSELLGVNRNTVLAAYRTLGRLGIAQTRRGGGTTIAEPFVEFAEEGSSGEVTLRDIGDGNPAPHLLPDPAAVRLAPAPAQLYGGPTIDPELAAWATTWLAAAQPRPFRLTVTAGAVDAIERLLASFLTPGDQVGLEDPCFLTSIRTITHAGYRPVAMAMDAAGIVPEALRAALDAGVRAVVCTPRAHNPTGVSLTPERAAELRGILADYPHVLIIEDDHFSLLATAEYASIIPDGHRRWALVRSMSKALGPDMRVAVAATDSDTAERLALRISGGVTWVSHHLQRLAHAMLVEPALQAQREAAATFYAQRNADCIAALEAVGLHSASSDGLNVWVDAGGAAGDASAFLRARGWLARDGGEFALTAASAATYSHHMRLTVHALDADDMRRLAHDLGCAVRGAPRTRDATQQAPPPHRAASPTA